MNKAQIYFLENVMPFLVLGVGMVIAIALFIVFFYLFIWGIVIGLILWGIMTIKEKLFPSAEATPYKTGRTIDAKSSHLKK